MGGLEWPGLEDIEDRGLMVTTYGRGEGDTGGKEESNGVLTNDGVHAPESGNFSSDLKSLFAGVVDYTVNKWHLFFETSTFLFFFFK